MNGIWTWQNGFPLTVLSGTDLSYTGVGRDHANYLGGAVDLSGDRTHREMTSRWFNTGTFAANTAGTFGTSPKGQFRGPRYFNVDYSVVKDTRITEKVNFQLRGEFFNLMNNVNLTSPNVTFSSAQFGQITTALDPRILQLSAKVTF
jgi:dihydroorotate dehydrogenase